MSRVLKTLALLLAMCSVAGADDPGVINAGNARFTVITPNLIRIEYSENKKFIDDRSLFAINRSSRLESFKRDDGDRITIDTGPIRLSFGHDPKLDDIRAQIRVGDRWTDWQPGTPNAQNLGGT